jgi:hypothetical protein
MSLVITIVTTANRTRTFQQNDPAQIAAVLDSLQRCAQWFRLQSLVIVGDDSTEIINPASITRIEIEAQQDLAVRLPTSLWPVVHAIPAEALTQPGKIDAAGAATRVDFYFSGGDSLAGWLETPASSTASERTARNARLFEEAVITYTTLRGGIGFINPATMTSTRVGAALAYPPATAWYASEA